MSSEAPIFHLFPHLPFELRREIYILATPPRIVDVRESWNFEDQDEFMEEWQESGLDVGEYEEFKLVYARDKFLERYGTEMLQTKLHPDLAYFAHSWRHRIPVRGRENSQALLEPYGFTSKNALRQPWTPTDEIPEIPLHWLENHLDVAFNLIRDSYLYSEAPIPALLHMCVESRQFLMDFGYRLSFATRTQGPRTWFHFDRDRLYLRERHQPFNDTGPGYIDYDGTLWHSYWNILGQFLSTDLQRVKRLVLPGGRWVHFRVLDTTETLLRIMPNLEEMFVERWDTNDFNSWYHSTARDNHNKYDPGRFWSCFPAEEIDEVAAAFFNEGPYDYERSVSLDGIDNIIKHQDKIVPTGAYFEDCARSIKLEFKWQRKRAGARWKIPKIKFVNVSSESVAERFVHGRREFWHYYMELKKAYARDNPFIPLTVNCLTPPPPFYVNWNSGDFRERFVKLQEKISVQISIPGLCYTTNTDDWPSYVTNGGATEPSLEIL
ncbi:uncharacterized protein F4822DRAFT_400142 [Hypoxylon trugodes]|uniref:uncharacterized protein n=1 Tax=Hypoxylon trugodes TaxID=326681 RepID=UPI0021949C1D|nr:uncharacterized protein F4822DRAFT_400142 [Hypoxylon trugodes]KAI1389899.1 hypothetical protein F4822DRAFT_400142 [Hypoxylon trugodes]